MKSNPLGLEGARYLRVGIVPASETRTDRPYMDEKRRLAACPLPTKGSFMDTFYKGWEIVRFFLAADAKLPSEAALPRPLARHVARRGAAFQKRVGAFAHSPTPTQESSP